MPEKRYKFFTVEWPDKPLPGRKTHAYAIVNYRSGVCLGVIRWYGPWRQFCFFPEGDTTVWSKGCLADVLDFMGGLK